MTVTEYRKLHPNCNYCKNRSNDIFNTCFAVEKLKSKRRAKKCPCYVPEEWRYDYLKVEK